jgi:hypothetical protein
MDQENTALLNSDLFSNMFKPHGVIIRLISKTHHLMEERSHFLQVLL